MKRERYMYGVRGEQYGIWNTGKKCWQFGICEDTPMLAEARLVQKIGDNAKKWRFEARVLPVEMRRAKPEPLLMAELQRKDAELKRLKRSLRQGRWFDAENDNGRTVWHCSCCDYPVAVIAGYPAYHFCPNCGAKMDEEASG